MRADVRFLIAAAAITFEILLAACASSTTAPTSSRTAAPVGISPGNNAVIAQNDPASGCALLPGADATRGLGFFIPFHWTAPSTANAVAGYEVYATAANNPTPAVDTSVSTTDYRETKCNTFVTDANLHNWQWRVRARGADGQFTDWSAWSTFQFAPCRLSDGTPCHAPN